MNNFGDCVGKQPVLTASQAPSVVSVPWAIAKIMRATVIPHVSSVTVISGSVEMMSDGLNVAIMSQCANFGEGQTIHSKGQMAFWHAY